MTNKNESRWFPEGTVTIRLHRRKAQNILMDRRDVDVLIVEELEMQRTENFHLKRRLGEQAHYIRKLEDAVTHPEMGYDLEELKKEDDAS
jgi:hypothetical protein